MTATGNGEIAAVDKGCPAFAQCERHVRAGYIRVSTAVVAEVEHWWHADGRLTKGVSWDHLGWAGP